jgi:hypothetical protein
MPGATDRSLVNIDQFGRAQMGDSVTLVCRETGTFYFFDRLVRDGMTSFLKRVA